MTNTEFEQHLKTICQRFLKETESVDDYVESTLNEMWDGETYVDNDGDQFQHEIPAHMTNTGRAEMV